MTDYYEKKTCPALDLVGLPKDEPVRAYLPDLEGIVNVGLGKDEQEAREDYLKNLCDLITLLQDHKSGIIKGHKVAETF